MAAEARGVSAGEGYRPWPDDGQQPVTLTLRMRFDLASVGPEQLGDLMAGLRQALMAVCPAEAAERQLRALIAQLDEVI